MMRSAVDNIEKADAHARLTQARDLMLQALNLIDGTPVATDCDTHLDHAIYNLTDAIAEVQTGTPIFTAQLKANPTVSAEAFGKNRLAAAAPNPWDSGTAA